VQLPAQIGNGIDGIFEGYANASKLPKKLAKPNIINLTPEKLDPIAPIRAAQKTLSYTRAFCFTHLMKSAFALLATFVTTQPILRVKKYDDSVSTC
jgi:hypothetical protein